MTHTQTTDARTLGALVDKVVQDLAASYAGVLVTVGDRLGLYRAMQGAGPVSSKEVAGRAGCAERYVREWLNAQAATGYVRYHAASGTYELTPEQAAVFADRTSPVFFPPAWQVPASMWFDEEKTVRAFRTGEGVAWGDHDARLFCGVAAFYCNGYRANLVAEWLPALEGVVEKLERGAAVADIGCGFGHSTALMAEAFPRSRFWGFDTHAASLDAARRHAAEAGVADRVTFLAQNAAAECDQKFELICFFDCFHDMGHPDAAAERALQMLADGGTVMLVEPYAADEVENNLNPIGQLYYSASTTLCCAHALSEKGDYSLGAQAGFARLSNVLRRAGFSEVRVATRNSFNLIIEARR
jgi:SAM-dependent methyltransferase